MVSFSNGTTTRCFSSSIDPCNRSLDPGGSQMAAYIIRRVLASLLILLAATFLMFTLVSLSGDPLAEFVVDTDPDQKAIC